MTNKYLEKIASIQGVADFASKVVAKAKSTIGTVGTAMGKEYRPIADRTNVIRGHIGTIDDKINTMNAMGRSHFSNTGSDETIKSISNHIGYQNKAKDAMTKNLALSQSHQDTAELAMRRARGTVAKVGAGAAVVGSLGVAAMANRNKQDPYYGQ